MEELQFLGLILICTAVAIIVTIYGTIQKKRKYRFWLRDSFGTIPKTKTDDFDEIAVLWNETKDRYPESEQIDDVTWNDLGGNALFDRMNTCVSFIGEQKLYATLHRTPKDSEHGNRLEKKIQYASSDEDRRVALQLALSKLGKKDESYQLPFIIKNLAYFTMNLNWLYRLMQVLFLGSLLVPIILRDINYLSITLAVFLVNLILYTARKTKFEVQLSAITSVVQVICTGKLLLKENLIGEEVGKDDLERMVKPFESLIKRVGMLQYKRSMTSGADPITFIAEYIMGATLLEFTSYERILDTLLGKEEQYMELYEFIGDLEVAIAASSFRESVPEYCIPVINERHVLRMDEVYHPLTTSPVYNSVTLRKDCLITGSNASGKSTFIKSVAVNLLLGQCIHTCLAREMAFPPTKIITSMAVTDDLMAGESYYIKEIKYLKRIITNLSEGQFMVCIIDEILRGTNTEERIAASRAILRYLSDKNCLAIVASHDIELTKLLDGIYENYHFEEKVIDHDIVFDYKIHRGPSRTKNAIRLLESIGFPDEIIQEAISFN